MEQKYSRKASCSAGQDNSCPLWGLNFYYYNVHENPLLYPVPCEMITFHSLFTVCVAEFFFLNACTLPAVRFRFSNQNNVGIYFSPSLILKYEKDKKLQFSMYLSCGLISYRRGGDVCFTFCAL